MTAVAPSATARDRHSRLHGEPHEPNAWADLGQQHEAPRRGVPETQDDRPAATTACGFPIALSVTGDASDRIPRIQAAAPTTRIGADSQRVAYQNDAKISSIHGMTNAGQDRVPVDLGERWWVDVAVHQASRSSP